MLSDFMAAAHEPCDCAGSFCFTNPTMHRAAVIMKSISTGSHLHQHNVRNHVSVVLNNPQGSCNAHITTGKEYVSTVSIWGC